MVRAIIEDGQVRPLGPLPDEWADGRKLVIQETSDEADGTGNGSASGKEFARLATQWKEETRFLSFSHQIAMNFAYQRIIGMGHDVLPLILRELEREPHHWFWALRAITGEDPVPPDSQGKVPEMASAWIRWAEERGVIQ